MHKTLTPATAWWPDTHTPPWRRSAARLLHAASRHLDRWAQAVGTLPAVERPEPAREFHALANGVGGALYLDGRLAGSLPGVTRL